MSQVPADPSTRPLDPDESTEDLLGTLAALGATPGGAVQAAGNLNVLARVAIRHLRKLVDAGRMRLWITRRGGRRLEGREFPSEDAGPVMARLAAGEGLAGWCIEHGQALRLAPGDARPMLLRGEMPEFASALVVPLFRR